MLHYTGFMAPRTTAKKTTRKPAKAAASALRRPKAGIKPKNKPKPWTAAEIEEAFRRFHRADPEPRGELQHINPYALLVAGVRSAQATDAGGT